MALNALSYVVATVNDYTHMRKYCAKWYLLCEAPNDVIKSWPIWIFSKLLYNREKIPSLCMRSELFISNTPTTQGVRLQETIQTTQSVRLPTL